MPKNKYRKTGICKICKKEKKIWFGKCEDCRNKIIEEARKRYQKYHSKYYLEKTLPKRKGLI